MKINWILCLSILLITVTACKKEISVQEVPLVKSDALIIGDPFDYGVNNLVIFPVGTTYIPEVHEPNRATKTIVNFVSANACSVSYDRYSKKEFINLYEDKNDIRNILFYDLKTGKTYSLLNETIHILSFSVHKEYKNPLIFFRVVKNDFNKDSIYNSKDPVMLYTSDLYGKNFTQITPDNEQFIDYTYYSETNTILIKTIIDSDHDVTFSNNDETNFREMKISDPSFGREIFKSELKDSLRSQIKLN